jgi:hypothetical protein
VVYDESRQQLVYFGGQDGNNGGNITAFLDRFGAWRLVDSAQSSSFSRADLLDGPSLLTIIIAHSDPVSQAVWSQLSPDVQDPLNSLNLSTDQKLSTLITGLNKLLQSSSFYDGTLFPTLPTEAVLLQPVRPSGANLIRFNRLLLEQAYPTQIAKSPSVPSGRMRLGAAYDSRRHALVIMGGEYNPTDIVKLTGSETWELISPDKLEIDQQPDSIYRKAGDLGGFHVGARAPAGETLSYQWFFENRPLNDDGRIFGSHSDILRIDTVRTSDAGRYYALVTAGSQRVQSQTAILTLTPALSIISLPADFHLVWGDPAVVLEHTDDVGGKWAPVPGATSPFRISGSGSAKFFQTRPTP